VDSFDAFTEPGQETVPAGTLIANRYRVVRQLGTGGMGSVYLATDAVLGDEKIAIKILHSSFVNDEVQRARFLREVQLMRKVNHRNVVRTFDVGVDGDLFYFTMEFVPGTQLEKLIGAKGIEKEAIPQFAIQMSEALHAIHSAGIIHRDLKPGNILVLEDGTLRITDFGVARPEVSDLTAHDEIIGSVCYIAPEVWLGKAITPAADLYALGIILYELTTGQVPFDGESPAVLMRAHLDRAPMPPKELNSAVPVWLNKIILRLLAKDPNARPRDAKEVGDFLRVHSENFTPEQSGVQAAIEPFFEQLETNSRKLTGMHDRLELASPAEDLSASVIKRVVTTGASSPHIPTYSSIHRSTAPSPLARYTTAILLVTVVAAFCHAAQFLLSRWLPALPKIFNNASFSEQAEALSALTLPTVAAGFFPHLLIYLFQLAIPALLIAAVFGSTTLALRAYFLAVGLFAAAYAAFVGYFLSAAPNVSHLSGLSLYSAALTAKDQLSAVALLSPLTNVYEQVVRGNGLAQNAILVAPLTNVTLSFAVFCLFVGLLCRTIGKGSKETQSGPLLPWHIVLGILLAVLLVVEGSLLPKPTPTQWMHFMSISLRLPADALVAATANWLTVFLIAVLAASPKREKRPQRYQRKTCRK
jgi:serine/threonine protein kinase